MIIRFVSFGKLKKKWFALKYVWLVIGSLCMCVCIYIVFRTLSITLHGRFAEKTLFAMWTVPEIYPFGFSVDYSEALTPQCIFANLGKLQTNCPLQSKCMTWAICVFFFLIRTPHPSPRDNRIMVLISKHIHMQWPSCCFTMRPFVTAKAILLK